MAPTANADSTHVELALNPAGIYYLRELPGGEETATPSAWTCVT